MALALGLALLLLTVTGFYLGRARALAVEAGRLGTLHSRPGYHGYFVALWAGLPAFAVLLVWLVAGPAMMDGLVRRQLPADVEELPPERLELLLQDARSLARGDIARRAPSEAVLTAADHYERLRRTGNLAVAACVLALAVAGLGWGRSRIRAELRARNRVESVLTASMVACSTVAILTTIGIVLSLIFEAWRFFQLVSPVEFLFGTQWSPQTALRADQVGSSGAFGAVPVFAGTLLITAIAMLVAVPVGLLSAIYLSDYAGPRVRSLAKPLLEILAGIPTVVYGFFAALTVAPIVRSAGEAVGLGVTSESALAAGAVMGIMIIPFVSSLSDDVINAVPQSLREDPSGSEPRVPRPSSRWCSRRRCRASWVRCCSRSRGPSARP